MAREERSVTQPEPPGAPYSYHSSRRFREGDAQIYLAVFATKTPRKKEVNMIDSHAAFVGSLFRFKGDRPCQGRATTATTSQNHLGIVSLVTRSCLGLWKLLSNQIPLPISRSSSPNHHRSSGSSRFFLSGRCWKDPRRPGRLRFPVLWVDLGRRVVRRVGWFGSSHLAVENSEAPRAPTSLGTPDTL